jgi:hypothetical protein
MLWRHCTPTPEWRAGVARTKPGVPLHSWHGVLHWACQPGPPNGKRDVMTSAVGSIGRPSSLNRRDFFAAIVADARSHLPPELTRFRHRANPMLLKLDYGNDRVHYEVWTDGARGRIEIGLHFEDGPASTMAYLAFFDQRIVEIKHLLGPQIELERWTISWGHLFESERLGRLDRQFAESVARRLAAQIAILQPMVEEAAIAPAQRDTTPSDRGRWRRRAKR